MHLINLKSSVASVLISSSILLATPATAEYYVAADVTYMDIKTKFANGTTPFEMNPVRLKFGQRLEEFGWEIHVLGPADDTGIFNTTGDTDEYEINYGMGVLWTVSSSDRMFYGGLGLTVIDTDYSVIAGLLSGASTSDTAPFFTLNLGVQYEFSKNTRLTADYTLYHGDISCNFCVQIPGGVDPDVTINSVGVGISHSF